MTKFAVLLVLVAVLIACVPAPRVGNCEAPPIEHEGHRMVWCAAQEQDASDVCCLYATPTHAVLVCAKACGGWEIVYDSNDAQPRGASGGGTP